MNKRLPIPDELFLGAIFSGVDAKFLSCFDSVFVDTRVGAAFSFCDLGTNVADRFAFTPFL